MGRSRFRFGELPFTHFLTCTVVGWLPVFARPQAVEFVLDSWRFLQRREGFELFGYVILENHLHQVAAATDLSKKIARFKSFSLFPSSISAFW